MRLGSRSIGVILCLGLLVSCTSNKAPANVESPSARLKERSELSWVNTREADDAGRFLAGLPGKEGSPYRKYESSPAWIAYARQFDNLWSNFEKTRMSQMRDFQQRELTGPPIDRAIVFYPFGGPDVLTVFELFPDRSEYVLASLEPPGTVPRFKKFDFERLGRQLPQFGTTLNSLLTNSFFITREMDRQLRGQVTDGLTPLLLVQLVRTGNTILRHGYTVLEKEGRMVGRHEDEKRAAWGGNRGVAIEFQKDGGGPKRILHYISVNLDNQHLSDNPRIPEVRRRSGTSGDTAEVNLLHGSQR